MVSVFLTAAKQLALRCTERAAEDALAARQKQESSRDLLCPDCKGIVCCFQLYLLLYSNEIGIKTTFP